MSKYNNESPAKIEFENNIFAGIDLVQAHTLLVLQQGEP